MNAYFGQEGFYIITDAEEQALGLPQGNYDIALALGSKVYNVDGSLNYDTNNDFGLFGDIIEVYDNFLFYSIGLFAKRKIEMVSHGHISTSSLENTAFAYSTEPSVEVRPSSSS